ncbi:hypothetical protein VCHA53O466_50312 [Vibrio chagasii]|nr:hypothetical protein VCHA53O466_50312 [Vibrio chagasii]
MVSVKDKTWDEFLVETGISSVIHYNRNRVLNGDCQLGALDEDFLSEEFLLEVAGKHPTAFRGLAGKHFTTEICEKLIANSDDGLELFPMGLLTPELVELAVSKNPKCIPLIPHFMRTDEILVMAAKDSAYAIQNILDEALLVDTAFKNPQAGLVVASLVPKEMQTKAFLHEAFQSKNYPAISGDMLMHKLNHELLDEKLLMLLVSNHPDMYSSIPPAIKTERVSYTACAQGFDDLSKVPTSHITEKLLRSALYNDCDNIAFAPEELLTLELCEYAATHAAGNLDLTVVPHKFRSEAVCLASYKFCFDPSYNFEETPDSLKSNYAFLVEAARANNKLQKSIKPLFANV